MMTPFSESTDRRKISAEVGITNEELKLEGFGVRHTLALLGFLAFTSVYAMRVNLSVAIVAMVNHTRDSLPNETFINDTDHCPFPDDFDPEDSGFPNGDFNWDSQTQGLILGSFFYGYACTNIVGGMAAEKWGGRLITGIGVVLTAILTVLSPISAQISTSLFIAVRILEGLAEGMTFPAMSCLIARWYPRNERSKFTGAIYSGVQFGTVITMPITGWLCATDFLGGWPSVFYFFGFLGLVWGVFWFWLVRDDPRQHPRISDAELNYIVKGCGDTKDRTPIPWASILTSRYFWMIAVLHFGNNWGFYTLLTELPTYLDNILHVNIKNNGMISAAPYLGAWLFCIGFSVVADKLIKRGTLSILSVRRLAAGFGGYGPMAGLILMCFIRCDKSAAFTILILSGALNGSVNCGHMSSHADISPRFAGTLMGLTNTIATIPGFVVPSVTGALTEGNPTISAWRIVFLMSALVYAVTVTLYVLLYRAEVQPWNEIPLEYNTMSSEIRSTSGQSKRNK